MSRIDMAFVSTVALLLVSEVSYLPRGISDHAPLTVSLLLLPRMGPTMWKLNSHWLKDEVVQGECTKGIADY